jgi:anti-anti-sigma factor
MRETMEGIQISAYYVGVREDIALIQIGGYLDTVTSPRLEKALEDLTNEGYSHIICDLGNVNYISSAGWGIFVSRIKRVRDMGGDLVLSRMIPDVFDVFRLLEFDRILKFYENTDKAIKDFDDVRGLLPETGEQPGGGNHGGMPEPDREGDDGVLGRGLPSSGSYPRSLLSPTVGEARFEDTGSGPGGNGGGARTGELVEPGFPIFPAMPGERNVLDRDLPLTEKVKLAVIDNPMAGAGAIRRMLNSSRFGYVKVGRLRIRKIFRELDLDTKEKRYRFWRSR